MAEVTFLTLGDIHDGVKWTPGLVAAAETADAVLVTGDITSFGGPDDVARILDDIDRHNRTHYAIAGNCDSLAIEAFLEERDIDLNGRGRLVGDAIGICGVSGSNRTPFGTPLEYTDEELAATLSAGWEEVRESSVRVIVHHAPPYGTKCDRIRLGLHKGVRGLREFCEREQPELVICGHIHEARGTDTIGETVVVNGGMAARGHGSLIEIDIDEGDIRVTLI